MVSLGGDAAFPPGSSIRFRTAHGSSVEGQVVCFDPNLKVLVVKNASNGKPVLRVFNLSLISDIKEISSNSASDAIDALLNNINVSPQQAAERYKIAEEHRLNDIMPVEIPLEGQQAFLKLKRTLDDVKWQEAEIRVLDGRVLVKEPYTSDGAYIPDKDCPQAKTALVQVKKILNKPFVADRRLTACSHSE